MEPCRLKSAQAFRHLAHAASQGDAHIIRHDGEMAAARDKAGQILKIGGMAKSSSRVSCSIMSDLRILERLARASRWRTLSL